MYQRVLSLKDCTMKQDFFGIECVYAIQSEGGQIFICNAKGEQGGKTYCECASGASLSEAKEKASQNLKTLLAQQSCLSQVSSAGVDKNMFKGGGDRPSTSSQQELLHSLAVRLGIDLGKFIHKQFHKSIPELLGHEADKGIKLLMAQIEEQKKWGF